MKVKFIDNGTKPRGCSCFVASGSFAAVVFVRVQKVRVVLLQSAVSAVALFAAYTKHLQQRVPTCPILSVCFCRPGLKPSSDSGQFYQPTHTWRGFQIQMMQRLLCRSKRSSASPSTALAAGEFSQYREAHTGSLLAALAGEKWLHISE